MFELRLTEGSEEILLAKEKVSKLFLEERAKTYSESLKIEKINCDVFPIERGEVYSLLNEESAYRSLLQKLPSEITENKTVLDFYLLDFDKGCRKGEMELRGIIEIFPEQVKMYRSFIEFVKKNHSCFLESVEEAERYGGKTKLKVKEKDFGAFENFLDSKKINLEREAEAVLIRRFVNGKGVLYDLGRDGERNCYENWIPSGKVLVELSPTPFIRMTSNLFADINHIYKNSLVNRITNTGEKSLILMKRLFSVESPSELHESSIEGFLSILKRDITLLSSINDTKVKEGIINKIGDSINVLENTNMKNPYTEFLQDVALQCRNFINVYERNLQKEKDNTKAIKLFTEMTNYLAGIDKGVVNISKEMGLLRIENAEGFRGVKSNLSDIKYEIKNGFAEVSRGQENIKSGIDNVSGHIREFTSSLNDLLGELLKDKK